MHFQTFLFIAAAIAKVSAHGMHTVVEGDDPLDLPIVDPVWSIPAFEGGDDLELRGTVESVTAQLKAINPDWHSGIQGKNPVSVSEDDAEWDSEDDVESDLEQHLSKRQYIPWQRPPLCNEELNGLSNLAYGPVLRIQQGADYLRGLGNRMLRQPPNSCGRISCSWRGGIWVCNNDRSVPRGSTAIGMADRVDQLIGSCSTSENGRRNIRGWVKDRQNDWRLQAGLANC